MTTQIGSGGPEAPRPPEVEEWRDKKRYLWLMGLIAPTALVVMLPLIWGMNQLELARRRAGAAVDRTDPALRLVAAS